MNRFKKILIAMAPGDLAPVSLRQIGTLAASNDSSVTILDVIEPLPKRHQVIQIEDRPVHVQELLVAQRRDELQRRAKYIGIDGVEVLATLGKPHIEVIRHVLSHEFDLVVVGERAPGDRRLIGLSSGVTQLLRKCPVPVWVMRPTELRRPRLLALVDPDPTDPVKEGLDRLVMELATSMAHTQEGELHVAHAWWLPGELTLASGPGLTFAAGSAAAVLKRIEDDAREQLEALAGRHQISGRDTRLHVVRGEPGVVLPELARSLDIDLILMGTVARTGISSLTIGNTAETILRSVACSVLAVKPDGFVSPVRIEGGGVAQ